MNQLDFFLNLLEYSQKEGFKFYFPEEQFEEPKQLSLGMKLFAAAAASTYAPLGAFSIGRRDNTNKEDLIADLERMREFADLVGIKNAGVAVVRLGINADNIPLEALIGRFALIHERVRDFRKYAPSIMVRSIFSDGKVKPMAQVVVAFSAHKKAREFIQNYADKCKHVGLFEKAVTYAWVIDLEDESSTFFPGLLANISFNGIRAAFFQKRS